MLSNSEGTWCVSMLEQGEQTLALAQPRYCSGSLSWEQQLEQTFKCCVLQIGRGVLSSVLIFSGFMRKISIICKISIILVRISISECVFGSQTALFYWFIALKIEILEIINLICSFPGSLCTTQHFLHVV